MGRTVDVESPITAATAVMMPATSLSSGSGALVSDTYAGFDGATSGTLSATNSITLMALTGPGVIGHFQVEAVSSCPSAKVAIWIDEELVYEETISFSLATGTFIGATFGAASPGNRNWLLDPIPFRNGVLVTIETVATVGWKTSTQWRLTD